MYVIKKDNDQSVVRKVKDLVLSIRTGQLNYHGGNGRYYYYEWDH